MGKDVFDASPAAQSVFFAADGALGEAISRLCFDGPEEKLVLTANTQPALVATSVALLEALREKVKLPAPAFAAGHSLGEYSALVAAGALELSDAIRLVRIRGQAMQEAVPAGVGAMAAVMGLDVATVEAVCAEAAQGEVVSPANFNGTQIVIAGHASAVERAGKLCADRKGKVIPLKVSAPFHCALMAPAARVMEAHLSEVSIGAFAFPVIANVDAQANVAAARVKELLIRQIDGVVRWEETIQLMAREGVTHAIEVGPGKVLAGLVKRIEKGITVLPCSDAASVAATADAIRALV
jgi:[acyl-carrier-protein] S-malonyltransferase